MSRTRGPWRYDADDGYILGADGFEIARIEELAFRAGTRGYLQRCAEERQSNGLLIASAPALLGGLKAAVAYLESAGASAYPAGAELLAGLRGLIDGAEEEDDEPPLVVVLDEDARATVEHIRRRHESDQEAVNRILGTLRAMAPDFDCVYGEPRDGKGPSGE